MTRLVLGSASTGRLRVLRNAGIEPLVVVSGINEDDILAKYVDASDGSKVCALARAKASAVVDRLPAEVRGDCVVIGCDSMLQFGGQLVGKPGTAEAAMAQWAAMAGHTGQLLTGHCIIRVRAGRIDAQYDGLGCTAVHFSTPTESELTEYIETGEPLSVAGAFTLDGIGGWFLDGIEGDASNVIGLSLPLLRGLLNRCGVSIYQLWTTHPTGSAS